MKIYLDTIGCRLNQAEIEQFARQIRSAGHTLASEAHEADLAIVNTSLVTSAAESASRQKIRQIPRSGTPELVATGCWATLHPAEASALPGVMRVVPNSSKDNLVSELLSIPAEMFDQEPIEREPLPGARLRTRAFIKAQDGCDNRCTFCVTTIAREPGRSRPVTAILKDIRAALSGGPDEAGGALEIVLTGVHLGSWGLDFSPPQHLSLLVRAIGCRGAPPGAAAPPPMPPGCASGTRGCS